MGCVEPELRLLKIDWSIRLDRAELEKTRYSYLEDNILNEYGTWQVVAESGLKYQAFRPFKGFINIDYEWNFKYLY